MNKDIALIGLAGRFPNSPDAHAFWQNIVSMTPGVSEPPAQAWDMEAVYDPTGSRKDRIYTKRGGFLGELATFNPLKHGVTPNAVEGTEPAQWLALEIARQAFDNAGFGKEIPHRERTAVIIGRGTYVNRANQTHHLHGSLVDETVDVVRRLVPSLSDADAGLIRNDLRRNLPPFDPTSAQGLIPNIIAGRIANKLDLMGPAYTVDAACASSVVALEQAVRGLRGGEIDMALVGGSYVVSPAPMTMVFAQLQVLSRKGEIAPFSAESDGTVLGEGIGMVVLKRLDDALADGNNIYAVIKGVGTASDGSGRSVIAPRKEGAVTAMRRALADADISADSVQLIEAHGLGTQVGDSVEFEALADVYGGPQKTALGTVKPMTGHLMPASGIAGLIKAALALHHSVLPPTLNADRPNGALDWATSNLALQTQQEEWIVENGPKRAAVNSFGFGGVAAHILLEEAPTAAARPTLAPVYDANEPGRVLLQTNTRTLTISDELAGMISAENPNPNIRTAPSPQPNNFTSSENSLKTERRTENRAAEHPAPQIGESRMTGQQMMNPLAPAMMAAYTDLMKTFLNVQRDVMIAALGGQLPAEQVAGMLEQPAMPMFQMPVAPPVTYTEPALAPQPYRNGGHDSQYGHNEFSNGVNGYTNGNGQAAMAEPVQQAPAAAPVAAPVASSDFSVEAAQAALVEIVADRTGYPAEMIELDLDLEADLGIDSIKRVEILGTFQKQFGDAMADIDMEDLAEKKSLREIVALVA